MQNGRRGLLLLVCALALVACDDTTSEDREDIVYLDGGDLAADSDIANIDGEDKLEPDGTPGDIGPADVSGDVTPSGCSPASTEQVCTSREAGNCGLMGGCDNNGCDCPEGYAVSAQGDCLPRIQDCSNGPNAPARRHVHIGVDVTGDNGIAKLFPYRAEVDGREYHAMVAVWKQGMTPDPEPRRIGLHYVHEDGTTLDDFGPEVRWPLAANEDELWTRYSAVGGLESLLLIDIVALDNPRSFFAIDNRAGPAQESVELVAGVTEVLPGTWPRQRIDLGRELELETGRIRDIRALAVNAWPIPDGGFSVHVAIFDDANPEEGIAIYNLNLNSNFELAGWYQVIVFEAQPDEFLAFEVDYARGRFLVNHSGTLFVMEGLYEDGPRFWEPMNLGDAPTRSLHQPLVSHDTACLDDVMILRGEGNSTSAWLDRGGALQFAQGTDALDTQRLFAHNTGPTIQLVWNQQDENSIDARLFMADVSVVDWSISPVRDLGRVNFGTSPGNGAEGLQVIHNRSDTTVAMLDRTIYRALPVRLEGLDVFIDVGAGCD